MEHDTENDDYLRKMSTEELREELRGYEEEVQRADNPTHRAIAEDDANTIREELKRRRRLAFNPATDTRRNG